MENLENLEFAGKKFKKTLGIWDFPDEFFFAKILMKLVDFRELQSIDQGCLLESPRKIHLGFHCLFGVLHLALLIFHLENLEFSFEKFWLPWIFTSIIQ